SVATSGVVELRFRQPVSPAASPSLPSPLSLHDALPISPHPGQPAARFRLGQGAQTRRPAGAGDVRINKKAALNRAAFFRPYGFLRMILYPDAMTKKRRRYILC